MSRDRSFGVPGNDIALSDAEYLIGLREFGNLVQEQLEIDGASFFPVFAFEVAAETAAGTPL
jgi:hypothetical protein